MSRKSILTASYCLTLMACLVIKPTLGSTNQTPGQQLHGQPSQSVYQDICIVDHRMIINRSGGTSGALILHLSKPIRVGGVSVYTIRLAFYEDGQPMPQDAVQARSLYLSLPEADQTHWMLALQNPEFWLDVRVLESGTRLYLNTRGTPGDNPCKRHALPWRGQNLPHAPPW